MKKFTAFLLTLFFIGTIYAQKTHAFFGSFNWDKNTKGIYVYELNNKTGKLTEVTSFSGISNPSYLTLSEDGQYIFACTESKTKNGGSVSSFQFNSEKGSISFINSQKSGGENPVYIIAHKNGKWLINGNYTEASVSVHPISENGKIKNEVQNFKFSEGSINPDRQEKAHIHSTVFSPEFDYVFMPDLGSDKIRIYPFKSDDAQPLQDSKSSFATITQGGGPRHFTFHPNGKFAYCIEEMGGAVTVFSYHDGVLKNLQRIYTHPEKYKEDFESSDVHISPDGKFLYASNRGSENNIAVFSIQNNGTLKSVGYQSTKGKHPRVFDLDPSGNFLVATNTGSSSVVVFRRNTETGLLKKVGQKIKIKNVSCVKMKVY